jgi:hypothetical protein
MSIYEWRLDWRFDIDYGDDGIMVDASVMSTIPNKRFAGLTRTELLALRKAISDALKRYPKGSREAAA